MTKSTIERLAECGQSAWLDNINRSMLDNGKLKAFIGQGLRGMTSNPAIFDKAIRLSSDYDKRIEELFASGRSTFEIYDELTVKDVQDAADIFKEVYDKTNKLDGYVSLEVDPRLAFKTEETIEEAKRLFRKVNRPNVMFKIPATMEGFRAVEALLAEGININVTLLFSQAQYEETAQAFLRGINRAVQSGRDLSNIQSVSSVFVSRIDTVVDEIIEDTGLPVSVKGKASVANSKLIFKRFIDIFSSEDFERLERNGANIQRVLWASTSTKNPAYSDIKYVTELIGKNTVNTLPDKTLLAFLDHGNPEKVLMGDIRDAQEVINTLKYFGVDMDSICSRLLHDGIYAFEESFNSLFASIEEKTKSLCGK